MPPLNRGLSTYHAVQGLYWRNSQGALLAVEGGNSRTLSEIWPKLYADIVSNQGSRDRIGLPSGKHINTLEITAIIPALNNIRSNFPPESQDEELVTRVAEVEGPTGIILGILTSRPKSFACDAFDKWAERFILLETEFEPCALLSASSNPEHRRVSEQVAELFEKRLKNTSRDDQWHVAGRTSFVNRVYGYVQKDQPILLCLPAFPCKSPNQNKVGGTTPDLAEHIALDVLRGFVKEIHTIYAPGATLWIISDGHVFSDCIGVDDETVDTYDTRLIEVYREKYPVEEGPVPAIQFKGLKEIFMSSPDSFGSFKESWLMSAVIPHPIQTARTHASELCRKLLLGVAQADRAFIRKCIEEQEPHALQLYRGQTRFMLEDLATVPSLVGLSNKQKRKTAATVAQEMISRNQAYSNLMELLLPNHIRLSIHAHDNSGPKFAVRLLPKDTVRPIASLQTRHEPVPAYEFQIPTPWHNSIIKVEGDELLYLARAEVARKAMAGPEYDGSWATGTNGGFFLLRRKEAVLIENSPPLENKIPERTTIASMKGIRKKRLTKSIDDQQLTVRVPLTPLFSVASFPRLSWQHTALDSYGLDTQDPTLA